MAKLQVMPEERHRTLTYRVHEGESDLSEEEKRVFLAAREALSYSYSPYSHFPVGAALLLQDGSIVQGSNQENVAHPSGICAERVAVWKAATQAPEQKMIALALITDREIVNAPVSPCGACRQVLSEFEERSGDELKVLFPGENGSIIAVDRVSDLLPFPFEIASLKDEKGER